jgi:hypothetical protein
MIQRPLCLFQHSKKRPTSRVSTLKKASEQGIRGKSKSSRWPAVTAAVFPRRNRRPEEGAEDMSSSSTTAAGASKVEIRGAEMETDEETEGGESMRRSGEEDEEERALEADRRNF